jgi:3-oxoacyl-(acyl-carrier-protein) synthase
MDTASETRFSNSITLKGIGSIVVPQKTKFEKAVDVTPWLKSRKMRKFMGKQDQLAVIAASLAARNAGLSGQDLQLKTGIYLCVGHIPFERDEIETIAMNSSQNGEFSMERFSTKGFDEVNPLLTFRCLPNMPIFHVSLNLNIQGPYFITYPGAGQFYLALEQAVFALQSGEIEYALVGGVADQNNFLVQHHFQRLGLDSSQLHDAAGFLCLGKEDGKRRLLNYRIEYNSGSAGKKPAVQPYGAAILPIQLEKNYGNFFDHLETMDGFQAESEWLL